MAHHENGLLTVPQGAQMRKVGNPTRPPQTFNLHHRSYKKLFPSAPSASDLTQGAIGDCYLIAALNAIVNCPRGPEMIEKCFLDQSSGGPSGQVIVRFFNEGGQPQYISMSKSVVTGLGARHTIWVKLFEKAYATMFLNGSYAQLQEVSGQKHGRGIDIYRAVLGTQGDLFDCTKNDRTFEICMAPPPGPTPREAIAKAVFDGDTNLAKEWIALARRNFGTWQKVIQKSSCYRMEDLDAFMLAAGDTIPDKLKGPFLQWIVREGILPGRRGTGVYSTAQKEVYNNIRTALTQKKPVSAGTNKHVAQKHKVIGEGQAGEGKALSGLAGEHAYSVLGAKVDEEGLRWIELENPWKNWGVRYERGTHTEGPKAGRKYLRPRVDPAMGRFWLELNDFTKHFKQVFVSGTKLGR